MSKQSILISTVLFGLWFSSPALEGQQRPTAGSLAESSRVRAIFHYFQAASLYRQKNLIGALSRYQEAVRWDPQFAEAYNNLGTITSGEEITEKLQRLIRRLWLFGRILLKPIVIWVRLMPC